MTIGILGKKLGMTQLFQEDGKWIPVTVVEAGPCKVLQVKTREVSELPDEHRVAVTNRGKKSGSTERPRRADGYYAVQIGFDDVPERNATQAQTGHAKKADSGVKRIVRELRYDSMPDLKQGDEINAGVFKDIRWVDVTGTSKGRGFSGAIKRHNFSRQSSTHGNSKSHRRVGGIGRMHGTAKGVPKGKKMPGHLGVDRVTVQSLEVVKIDEARNLVFVRGAVPGHRNSYVLIRKAVKRT